MRTKIGKTTRNSRRGDAKLAMALAAAYAMTAASLAATGTLRAGTYTWNNSSGGNWSNGADWTLLGNTGSVPGSGSYATILLAGAAVTYDYAYTGGGLGGVNLFGFLSNVSITQSGTSTALIVDAFNGNSQENDTLQILGSTSAGFYASCIQTGGSNYFQYLQMGPNGNYYLDTNSGNSGTLATGSESIGSGAYFAQGGGTNMASNLDVQGKFVLGYEGANQYATGTLKAWGQNGVNEVIGASSTSTPANFIQMAQPFFPSINDANSLLITGSGTAYDLWGGELNIGSVQVIGSTITLVPNAITDNAIFTQTGGSIQDALGGNNVVFYLNPTGTFTYAGGGFNARLINQGTFTLSGPVDFTAGNGMENDASLTVTAGQTIALDGQGLNNQATMTIQGGTLSGGGTLTNNGQLNILGTIGGTGGFVNNGTVGTAYGSTSTQIILSNTGPNANNGTLQLSQGYSLNLSGGSVTLANAGTINLNGGGINGTGTLNNNSGGTINGAGVVSASLNNSGGEISTNGGTITLVNLLGNNNGGELLVNNYGEINSLQGFTSSGEIVLAGSNAVLAGGTIANSGTISGFGRVGNTIANTGTIRADGGNLTLTGAGITNSATGNIEAATADTVTFAQGLAANAGTIALSGGTLDNNNNPLTNSATGYLVGNGTIRTGGLTNLNSISVADAATAFYGPVINGYVGTPPSGAATPIIQITSNTTTFYGPVTNESGAFIFSHAATVNYLGAYVNNGTVASDPSTTTFVTITEGTTGITQLGAGDEYKVALNFYNNSTQNTKWNTAQGILEFTGNAHTMTVAGTDNGASYTGFTNNFAWDQLILDSGASLKLGKGTGLAAAVNGAFYTYVLTLVGGTGQIAGITGNGVNIYYDPANSANAYLHDATYALTGGGEIAPVPEPAALGLMLLGGMGLLMRKSCIKMNHRSARVRASALAFQLGTLR